jgi:exosortase H (IPTLxxWG-CTERM-specific)
VIRFFVTFLALQVLLFGAELTPWAQEYFVVPWTNALASISVWLVTVIDPNVAAVGKVIRSSVNGFAVSIEAGCNGIEATIVLIAAIFAFPASWLDRIKGLAAGIVAVQGLNVVRVISLFYLGQWNMQVFEWAHLYVWQALIMLDVLVVWLVWVASAA